MTKLTETGQMRPASFNLAMERRSACLAFVCMHIGSSGIGIVGSRQRRTERSLRHCMLGTAV